MSRATAAPSDPVRRVLLRWLVRLLTCTFAAMVLFLLAVLVVVPRATHGQAMTVLTGSMTPGIPVGSVVEVRPVDPGTLHVGDIATYQKAPGRAVYVTHRISGIDTSTTPTTFTFKGDANRGPDLDPVVPKQIRGKVWFHVPYVGAIRDGLHGKGGITLVAMLLLAGYGISQVGAGLRERKANTRTRPVELPTDRRLVSVTLDTDRLTSRRARTPEGAAVEWGALLVHQDEYTCTLVLAPANSRDLAACLEHLTDLEPRRLLVTEGPIRVTVESMDSAISYGVDHVEV